jgi:BirA family transcriptional regulator, biotin operon repressor / biotin---[acetyl-CoA-carboxylase] ligase
VTDHWPVAELRTALDALLPGFAVEVVGEIDSTNTELMRRARAGVVSPVLLVAERQTAGRGRLGRLWESTAQAGPAADASLTFSIGMPLAPADWSGLSLAVGVSVAESLDPAGEHRIGLKWPNDIWVNDRKLVGILIETALPHAGGPGAQRYAVIGVGINIGVRQADGMRAPPAWLQQFRPDAQAPQVLADVAPSLVRSVLDFAEHGFSAFGARFAARDVLCGREVTLSDGDSGLCEGVGPAGELRVKTAAGLRSITSSEVSVRPAEGAPQ